MLKYSWMASAVIALAWLVGFTAVQQKDAADKKALENIVKALQEAYNHQDVEGFSKLWTADAIYNNPVTGESAEGREAIKKFFREKFAQGTKRRLEIEVTSTEFPHADEIIEKGVMKVTLGDQPPQRMAYQASYAREDGRWLLKAIDEVELQQAPSHYDQLKGLEWLVGQWEDLDENIEIIFDNRWDKYKNFITQNFSMTIFGQDEIEGKQIIAWDAENDTIRSWVFDSDGGFGQGTWAHNDNSWYVTMRYTLSDGSAASSKNIYTYVDDRSYTFASVEREVNGEILPDMDPVTVERVD